MPTNSEASVRLPSGVDLHARPAAQLVKAAVRFTAAIQLCLGERQADAKSILDVLALGVRGGDTITLRANGTDAEAAVAGLSTLLESLDQR